MVRVFCAVLALLLAGGVAGAQERTMHFDNLVLKFEFPSRFAYVDRDEAQVYFSDGETVIEFSWRWLGDFPDDAGAKLLEEIETYPTYGRVDGHFRDDLEFEIALKEKYDRAAFIRWTDRGNGYTRLSYAMTTCCDRFILFTIEYPSSVKHDWLEGFYASFKKGDVGQYDTSKDDIDVSYRMMLPRAGTRATSDAQRLYDACSNGWNKRLYGARPNAKAMGAYIIDGEAWCQQAWGHKSEASAWEVIQKACDEKGAADCYRFAKGDELSEWADEQRVAAEYGSRDDGYRQRQEEARAAAAAKERRRTQLIVRINNKDRFDIGVAFYSSNRKNFGWPGNNRHWVMSSGEKREFALECQPGEKICYGAARKNNNSQIWGVGLGWVDGCQGCCMTCGHEYGYSLADGGPYREPQVSRRSGNDGVEILGSVLEGLALGLGAAGAIQNSSPPPAPRGRNFRQSDISGTR
ncbi:MAG: hypothetical protein J0H53_05525 [Rhizobiales bacterium]|nr:hypothetical protein [Hyphomicrobiales bacterium]OJU37137.1 MAG: hypothetical protein BGN94_08085 [Rhizobiales bacterium 68-8]